MKYISSYRYFITGFITVACIIAAILAPPVNQDPGYHNFSDCRHMLGVHNFWNVVTNLPFLLVGIYCLVRLNKKPEDFERFRAAWICFSLGAMLTAFGSGYYHYVPSNFSLVWDRIPMTIIFMSLLSIVVSGYINTKAGKYILFPMLALGIYSVFHWYSGEVNGAGDLRLYAFVQFWPLIIIPFILFLFRSDIISEKKLLLAPLAYVAAKFAEHFDHQFHAMTGFFSGHSLKHILAAVAIFAIARAVGKGKEEGKFS